MQQGEQWASPWGCLPQQRAGWEWWLYSPPQGDTQHPRQRQGQQQHPPVSDEVRKQRQDHAANCEKCTDS